MGAFEIDGHELVAYHGNEEHVVIPEDVLVIGEDVFRGNAYMRTVDLGEVAGIKAEAFMGCSSLETLVIPTWTGFIDERAFKGCRSLKSVELGRGKALRGPLEIFDEAFAECTALERLDLCHTSRGIMVFGRAFAGCTALTYIDLSSKLMELDSDAFEGCTALEYVGVPRTFPYSRFNVQRDYKDTLRAFIRTCPNLHTLERHLTEEEVDEYERQENDEDLWYSEAGADDKTCDGEPNRLYYDDYADLWKGRPAESLFQDLSQYDEIDLRWIDTWQDESLACMFKGCTSLRKLNLYPLDMSAAKDLRQMFFGCRSLKRIDLSRHDTSRVESMAHLFHNCHALEEVDLSFLDLSRVKSIWSAFDGCESLEYIELSGVEFPALEKVGYAFRGCESLDYCLDLSHFDLSRVESLSHLFCDCWRMPKVDLSWSDLRNVTDMRSTFEGCTSLMEIDLQGLEGARVKNMNRCFKDCWSLTEIDLSGVTVDVRFVRSAVGGWFRGCRSLKTLRLPKVMGDSYQVRYRHLFDGCGALVRWEAPESWPVNDSDAIPMPTNDRGAWWSQRDQRWMTVEEIRNRGPVADTYTRESDTQ